MTKTIHLSPGDKFNRLTFTEELNRRLISQQYKRIGRFTCDCGVVKELPLHAVRTHKIKSCGCLIGDTLRDIVRKRWSQHEVDIEQGARSHLWTSYRQQAKIRHLVWDLSKEQFAQIIRMDCHYCGRPPQNRHKPSHVPHKNPTGLHYNGIDRVDSQVGYLPSNVVPCCGQCNLAKASWSFEDFASWIKMVAGHLLITGR